MILYEFLEGYAFGRIFQSPCILGDYLHGKGILKANNKMAYLDQHNTTIIYRKLTSHFSNPNNQEN